MAQAKDLLETSSLSLAQIAAATGFGAESNLRHHFRRITATTPGAYRRRFAGLPAGKIVV